MGGGGGGLLMGGGGLLRGNGGLLSCWIGLNCGCSSSRCLCTGWSLWLTGCLSSFVFIFSSILLSLLCTSSMISLVSSRINLLNPS